MPNANVTKATWGYTASGMPVERYTLGSDQISVDIITFGARVVSLEARDRAGVTADVVLGYRSLAEYEADATYQGAIVGRYGNRIAHGTFEIDGHVFHVPTNNNGNALHGGPEGFDKKVWTAHETPGGVEMTLVSGDGQMGFPGELSVSVRYTIEENSLHVAYAATTTKPTVVNLTSHSYFNLRGEGQGTILDHALMLDAAAMTPVDAGLIPTGDLAMVAGTPFDFRVPTRIGERIDTQNEQLKFAGGYDHNWVLNGEAGSTRVAAIAHDPVSGRSLTVRTTEPGVQFYSGNSIEGMLTGKSGVKYEKHFGFCLETQHFPDSPNHPEFPSTLLMPGETLHSQTIFSFSVEP